ncbi:MAG: hypothetical protein ABI640_03380 [Gammaproteobacteria bacterium]
MTSKKGSTAMRIALATGLATLFSVVAHAQFGGPPPVLYTPAEGAKDLKSVLYNWPWRMVMLRGLEEHELAVTLEYRGEGTIQVNGQACAITPYKATARPGELGKSGYRIGSAYQFAGSRTQIECTLPNGTKYSNIEVVSGKYAWDEDRPGAGLVKGEGTAKPMPGKVDERLIRLWASPQGAVKAALAGAGIGLMKVYRNPGGLLEAGKDKIGDTSVRWEGNTPLVTFPIPGVAGATAVATLDDKFMAKSVVVKHGRDTYEFTYSDYNDYNNPLNRIESQYAGKMTERLNGKVMRDLKTAVTETGSVYVVVPVPPNVSGVPTPPLPMYGSDQKPIALTSTAATPRLPDGKPNLTGSWRSGNKFFIWRYGNRRCSPTQLDGCSEAWNQTLDFEFEAAPRFGPNRPIYKPSEWDKVVYLDMWTNKEDPVMTCQPLGIPRQGAPGRIFHTDHDITMIYGRGGDGGGGYSDFRVIATDGRAFDKNALRQTMYTGHSVGHWDGDTLVIESVAFVPETWLSRGGFFHSEDMKVIERFTRKGEQMLYEVTVDDPEVLIQPWKENPLLMTLADGPEAPGGFGDPTLVGTERGNCETYELGDVDNQIHH